MKYILLIILITIMLLLDYGIMPYCIQYYINVKININILVLFMILLNMYLLYNSFINAIILSLLSLFLCNNNKNSYNSNSYNSLFIYFGKISYPLYLFHYIFCNNKRKLINNLINLIVIAIIIYYMIEYNVN